MHLYRDFQESYVPIQLARPNQEPGGSRLFGAPPRGVQPAEIHPQTAYFATLHLEGDTYVSVFLTFEYSDRHSPFDFFEHGRELLRSGKNPMLQYVVHGTPDGLDEASPLKSELEPCGLRFGAWQTDPPCRDIRDMSEAPFDHYASDHKSGGVPYFEHLEGQCGETLQLWQQGWVHLLQLVFPGAEDFFGHGSWPFGEDPFHLFARRTAGTYEFAAYWG